MKIILFIYLLISFVITCPPGSNCPFDGYNEGLNFRFKFQDRGQGNLIVKLTKVNNYIKFYFKGEAIYKTI